MRHSKRIRLYHTSNSEAHPSFAMSSNGHSQYIVDDLIQGLSGDKTGERDSKTFNIFRTSPLAVCINSGESKSDELGLLFCHRDLSHIQRSRIGIH